MHTDEAGFLAAILANPAADLPRLVYADWLEENGEAERAEFIRVQCRIWETGQHHCYEACRLPDFEGCPNKALRRRERELWGDPNDRAKMLNLPPGWLATIVPENLERLSSGWVGNVLVRRGFVHHVAAPLAVLFGGPCHASPGDFHPVPAGNCPACSGTGTTPGRAADLWRCQPVERVTLTDRSPMLAADSLGRGWTWSRRRFDPDDGYTITPELHAKIPTDRCQPAAKVRGYRRWDTPEIAHEVLSAACVALGRDRAGLPATPAPRKQGAADERDK